MKAKHIISAVIIVLSASSLLAVVQTPFSNWDTLVRQSSDIIVARCIAPPELYTKGSNGIIGMFPDGLINTRIEPVIAIKGVMRPGASNLKSGFLPAQGDYYLIFSEYRDGRYQAGEHYRIVPLGASFSTNSIVGKPSNEQILILLQRRLNDLNRQMKQEQEEKERLEQAFQK